MEDCAGGLATRMRIQGCYDETDFDIIREIQGDSS